MDARWTSDRRHDQSTSLDRMERGHRINIRRTCLIRVIITIGWSETWQHRTRWSSGAVDHRRSITHVAFLKSYNGRDASTRIASQPLDRDLRGDIWSVFITLTSRLNHDRPSRSDGHDLIETVHDGPFHRNRRSNSPYKTTRSSRLYAFELDFNKIDLSRHESTHFSWFLPLPLSFPHPWRGWNQDLVENRRRNHRLKPVVTLLTFSVINRLNHLVLIAKQV